MMGKPSEPKDTRHSFSHAAMVVTVSSISEEFPGLKTNNDGISDLYGSLPAQGIISGGDLSWEIT